MQFKNYKRFRAKQIIDGVYKFGNSHLIYSLNTSESFEEYITMIKSRLRTSESYRITKYRLAYKDAYKEELKNIARFFPQYFN